MKPHLQFLIFECILPVLCLSPADLALWKEDPAEFVRRAHGTPHNNNITKQTRARGGEEGRGDGTRRDAWLDTPVQACAWLLMCVSCVCVCALFQILCLSSAILV